MDYKKLQVDNYYNKCNLDKANDIVANYVKEQKLIIYGGQAIDFALRIHGEKIYEDYVVPDYDFYSMNHIEDGYRIVGLLLDAGFKDISMIHAIHPTTIKIRINRDFVADISFIFPEMYKLLQKDAIIYDGFLVRNPKYQFVDFNRSFAYPYEGEPNENINNRWIKDFKRYNILCNYYLGDLLKYDIQKSIKVSSYVDKNFVVCGDLAIMIYLGIDPQIQISGDKINYVGFDERATYLLDSQNMELFIKKYSSELANARKSNSKKSYVQLIDWLPERIETDKLRLLKCNNKTGIRTAKHVGNLRVPCVNYCVMYAFAMHIVATGELANVYYWMFCQLNKILHEEYSRDTVLSKFLYPSIDVYGEETPNVINAYIENYAANGGDIAEIKGPKLFINAKSQVQDIEMVKDLAANGKFEIKEIMVQDGKRQI